MRVTSDERCACSVGPVRAILLVGWDSCCLWGGVVAWWYVVWDGGFWVPSFDFALVAAMVVDVSGGFGFGFVCAMVVGLTGLMELTRYRL